MIKLKNLLFEVLYSQKNIEEFKKTYGKEPNKDLFDRFNKVLPSLDNKDIFSYDSYDKLINTINNPTNNEKKIKDKTEGYEKVFYNGNRVVYRIKTREGAIFLGKGTKWCISSENTDEHWKGLKNSSSFYVILPDKLCVQVKSDGIFKVWDELDKDHDHFKIPKDIPLNIFEFIQLPLVIDDFVKGKYKLTPNGYDVNGSVNLEDVGLQKIPFKFHKVTGDFICSDNKLTSLENCPIEVGGDFYCMNNYLTTLEYCPQKVAFNFYCSQNDLITLKGCPSEINRNFDCSWNNLTSLEFCPKQVSKNFDCSNNFLNSLDHSPTIVMGNFYGEGNELPEYKQQPDWVLGNFRYD